ncbi:MAG: hypothetical protein HPY89_04415 [Pelotomaculum sp.]|nr:hypothetical protein [Pelotomaculum sp.]
MTRREIFFTVSIAFFGLIILLGAYLWKENYVSLKEREFNQESYTKQAEELQKEGTPAKAAQSSPASAQPASPAQTRANPAPATTPGSVSNPPSTPAPPAAASINNIIASGSKVGDLIKFGDVEMIVTKTSSRHKVIDITLTGNTSEQAPKLILSKNNRIVYEVPADVDVNVNVTEKTVIDKSPLFDEESKAGK